MSQTIDSATPTTTDAKAAPRTRTKRTARKHVPTEGVVPDPEVGSAPEVGRSLHGAETLFVEGEGVLAVQLGAGDAVAAPVARSRVELLAPGETPPFRFRRIGPRGKAPNPAVLTKVAAGMTTGADPAEGTVPSGYTYLGQFIDHDLTMDATPGSKFGQDVSPAELLQHRSPTLDLDSLYGAGPSSEVSAGLYEDGLHLKVGSTGQIGNLPPFDGHDLPRHPGAATVEEERVANVGDPRNDENLAVAQTHVAFLHFHNKVVDAQEGPVAAMGPGRRFRRARRKTTLHYQWLVWHDYLPRICDPDVLDEVWHDGRVLIDPVPQPFAMTAMPIEFSIAAFRLGHSMVRAAYNWNSNFPGEQGTMGLLFSFSDVGGDIFGLPQVPSNWIVDWRRLYDFPAGGGGADLVAPLGVNHAMRIDTRLTEPLGSLPPSTFGGDDATTPAIARNLAFRNLTRAAMVDLATGQGMARKLKDLGSPVPILTPEQVLEGASGADLSALTPGERHRLGERTPLWFYVLREAELNGGRMTGVGARIVAETMHRAMEGSRVSLVREVDQRGFEPHLGPRPGIFEMTDLLRFAFGETAADLAPIG